MKKLAHVFNSIEYSGAERMIYTLHDFYTEQFIPYAISTGESKGEFYNQFSKYFICHHIPISNKRNWQYILDFIRLINFYKKEKINIIHIHPSRRFFFNALAAKLGGVDRIIRQVHNNFYFKVKVKNKETLGRHLAKLFGVKIVSISKSVYNTEFIQYYNKTILINNFYNDEDFFPASEEEKTNARNNLKIPSNSFSLISIGTCIHRKQHNHIIKALSELKPLIPNIFYIHLGEGELENKEKILCENLNVIDSVLFTGNVNNVRDYIIAADLYIMTSEIEGLGNATIEAMGSKIPVVLYDTPGSRDLGNNGAPGILIVPSISALVTKILELYNNKKTLCELGNKSFNYVCENYSMNQAKSNWSKIYQS